MRLTFGRREFVITLCALSSIYMTLLMARLPAIKRFKLVFVDDSEEITSSTTSRMTTLTSVGNATSSVIATQNLNSSTTRRQTHSSTTNSITTKTSPPKTTTSPFATLSPSTSKSKTTSKTSIRKIGNERIEQNERIDQERNKQTETPKVVPTVYAGLPLARRGLAHDDVAVIVPYRDRKIHLKIFTNYMNTFFLSQNSSARIYIVEQDGNGQFNRAKLFNVGYHEAKKDYPFSCFIFHDIDLIPEVSEFIYQCEDRPIHMSAFIDKFNYKVPYSSIFGGASALNDTQMQRINGFPNRYWGWGGEDDDMSRRVREYYRIGRPPAHLGRYSMLRSTGKHTQAVANPARFKNLREVLQKMHTDGINSTDYKLLTKTDNSTFVWVLADLKENGILNSEKNKPKPKSAAATQAPKPTPKPLPVVALTTECAQTQTNRKATLKKLCDAKHIIPTDVDFHTWRRHTPNVLVLPKERALYCFIPEASSVEWKTKILAHLGIIKEQDYKGVDPHDPNGAIQHTLRKYGLVDFSSLSDGDAQEVLKTHFKFAFFMNPFMRLFGGFRRLSNTENKLYNQRVPGILEALHAAKGTAFTLEHFLASLTNLSQPAGYDIHWKRYADLCNPCAMNYDLLGQSEDLAKDAACALPPLHMDTKWFPTPPPEWAKNAWGEAQKLYPNVSQTIMDGIQRIFGGEAAMFDYKVPGKL